MSLTAWDPSPATISVPPFTSEEADCFKIELASEPILAPAVPVVNLTPLVNNFLYEFISCCFEGNFEEPFTEFWKRSLFLGDPEYVFHLPGVLPGVGT